MTPSGPSRLGSVLDQVVAKLESPEHASRVKAEQEAREHRDREIHLGRIRQMSEALWQTRGKRYRDCTFSNFRLATVDQREAVRRLAAYAEDVRAEIERGTNVILVGPSGTGKDHLLAALMKAAVGVLKSVKWTRGTRLWASMRDAMDTDRTERQLLSEYTSPDVLVVSDPMPVSGSLTPFQQSTLYEVIDERYNNVRPTWVAVNASNRQEAEQRIGTAIVDRLAHDAVVIPCNWPTYRKSRGGPADA